MKIWKVSCIVGALTGTSLAVFHQVAVSRPSVATPNAIVAAAFSTIPRDVATVLTEIRAAFPAPPIEVESGTTSSANVIVAAEFDAVGPFADEVIGSLRQERSLPADVSVDAALTSEAALQQGATPAALLNPGERELPYPKDSVYAEIPRPESHAEIASAALSDVPLGTPVQEINHAAESFGLDANFMKAVAKIESDLNPRERTGSYIGLFQLSRAEFRQYGAGDILNPRDNAMAAAHKFATEAARFEQMTHKKLTFADLYLIHQQGWEGAAEHVSHPQRIAWKSVCATREGMTKGERWCKRVIWGNTLPAVKRERGSVDRLTSGAFVAMWRDRIETLVARSTAPRPEI